ncbi:MAG: hypothetical protein ACJAYU_004535 [Bradymonadia bacterium]|jgi:hypothetical protein
MTTTNKLSDTWATLQLEKGESAVRSFGPLLLQIERRPAEWRIRRERSDGTNGTPAMGDELVRVATSSTTAELSFHPMLADRPVVAHPAVPVAVLPGEEVRFFVSTPLSVQIRVGGTAVLAEVATVRLSDTWFGPDTRTGVLCYASSTGAHTEVDGLSKTDVRAKTTILLKNRGVEHFPIHRIQIPAPHLSLFADATNGIWTEELVLNRTRDGSANEGTPRKPTTAGTLEQIESPRREAPRGFLRTVGGIFQ